MKELMRLYTGKIIRRGMAGAEHICFGSCDDVPQWTGDESTAAMLEEARATLGLMSLLRIEPEEPWRSAIKDLAAATSLVCPSDCETRTFLHDIPVVREETPEAIVSALGRRKGAITPRGAILGAGAFGPEQAFVHCSSVCFSTLVNRLQKAVEDGCTNEARLRVLDFLDSYEKNLAAFEPGLATMLPADPEGIVTAMSQAGQAIVNCGLVDSFFGNISCLHSGIIYISQTGSSLDNLRGNIDFCPLDNSSCAGITASSEYTAHRRVLIGGKARAILHGHPLLSVTMSLLCEHRPTCEFSGLCASHCCRERMLGDTLIVSGEVGTGPRGLCNTLPVALGNASAALVYGHGVFATSEFGFAEAFDRLRQVELNAISLYRSKLAAAKLLD